MECVLLSIGTFVLGAAFTWLVSERSTREIAKKLPPELVSALRETDRLKFTLDEIEQLVLSVGYPTEFGIIPHNCPSCGSSKIRTYSVEGYDGDHEMAAKCEDCGRGIL